MIRRIDISLEKRGVTCTARLLDDRAPKTCDLVWAVLPQAGPAFHAKYAMNEVYCLVPPLGGRDIGRENTTVVPIPGDVCYFYFPVDTINAPLRAELGFEDLTAFVDLAIFYDRNNFLFNPATGFVPTNVFATIESNLAEMADACQDVWRSGSNDERLIFRRH